MSLEGRRGGLAELASGEVGDSDPLQAIDDALRTFGGDLIIVADPLVAAAVRDRFDVPVVEL